MSERRDHTRRRRGVLPGAGVVGAVLCVASCDEAPTMIIARVESDLTPCTELTHVHLRAQWENGAVFSQASDTTPPLDVCAGRLRPPGEIRVTPRDPADSRRVVLQVTGTARTPGGAPYTLRQEFVTRFQQGRVMYVAFSLTRVCANNPCPAGYSCVPGPAGAARCASPEEAVIFPHEQTEQRDATVWSDTRSEIVAGDGGGDAPDEIQNPAMDADVPAMDASTMDDAFDAAPDVTSIEDVTDAEASTDAAETSAALDAVDAADTIDVPDENDASAAGDASVVDDAHDVVEDEAPCAVGQSLCGATCRDLSSDRVHCGRCDSACPAGARCVSGACEFPRSCAEYRRLDATLTSGIYTIDLDGTGPRAPLEAYCDMATEGGGWTLVARIRSDSAAHNNSAAVGALTSPTQSTPAKLSDGDINALRNSYGTSLVRFDCRAQRTYFQQDAPFVATSATGALMRCSASPTGPWSMAMSYGTHLGLSTYTATACPNTLYFYGERSLSGCVCGTDSLDGMRDGAMWVRDGCTGTSCLCPPGRTSCSGLCRDLADDPEHCGTCGVTCALTQQCLAGVCVARCAAGETRCGVRCVNTSNDRTNCGTCGRDCIGGACTAGTCQPYLLATLPTSRLGALAFDGTFLYAPSVRSEGMFRVRPSTPTMPTRIIDGTNANFVGVFGDTLYWSLHIGSTMTLRPVAGGTNSSLDFGASIRVGASLLEADFAYAITYDETATSTIYRMPSRGGAVMRVTSVPASGGAAIIRSRSGDLFVGAQFSGNIWRVPMGTGTPVVFASVGGGRSSIEQLAEDDRYLYATSCALNRVVRFDRMTSAITVLVEDIAGNPCLNGLVVTDTMIYFTRHIANDIWAMRK